jgi:hypothetical protein
VVTDGYQRGAKIMKGGGDDNYVTDDRECAAHLGLHNPGPGIGPKLIRPAKPAGVHRFTARLVRRHVLGRYDLKSGRLPTSGGKHISGWSPC